MNFTAAFLFVIGVALFIYGFTMETSVSVESSYLSSVSNIGLMQKQSNIITLASVAFISGIILYGFSIISGQLNDLKEDEEEDETEEEEIEDLNNK